MHDVTLCWDALTQSGELVAKDDSSQDPQSQHNTSTSTSTTTQQHKD